MKLAELKDNSVLILGLGREGRSTWRWLRSAFPEKTLALADRLELEQLGGEVREPIQKDARLRLHLGPEYLHSLFEYDVMVKSPGIPVTLPEYRRAVEAGRRITSQTALFFANCPGRIVGVTGTKGKSTTASLIHAILTQAGRNSRLVGNIGVPALDALPEADRDTLFVYELSSHQLEGLGQSPQIAVLLNVVPEHLDYYENFEQYAAAKENITRFQTVEDCLVYDADHSIPREMAARSRARKVACSLEKLQRPGCYLWANWMVWRSEKGDQEVVVAAREVPLPGTFNLANVAAAVAVGKVLEVPTGEITAAVRGFQPLEHRLERVGAYDGVTYYNDSIATVPEATLAALDALGEGVETILLGGAERRQDFSGLAKRLLQSRIRTVILFPPTGERIWRALVDEEPAAASRLEHFFVESMEEAVGLARRRTAKGRICLHSPASPSFGLFRDYRERGERFKQLARGTVEERKS